MWIEVGLFGTFLDGVGVNQRLQICLPICGWVLWLPLIPRPTKVSQNNDVSKGLLVNQNHDT